MIVAWNTQNPDHCSASTVVRQRQLAVAPRWTVALDLPGLVVYVGPSMERADRVITMHRHVGVFLGTLFESNDVHHDDPARVVTDISVHQTQKIVDTLGQSVSGDFWGSYVLAMRHPSSGHTYVLRGPMSQLRCLYARFEGVALTFSSVDDCAALGLLRLTVNWDCIAAQAAGVDYLSHETGLLEVSSLDGGECLQVAGDACDRHVYWEPKRIACRPPIESFDSAVAALRKRVQYSVSSWASLHDSVVLTLSGGLDSSIILSCLTRAPNRPKLCAVTHYSSGIGDEREYARSMAKMYDVELLEHERNHAVDLHVFTDCGYTERPVLHFSACDAGVFNSALAASRHATAIFDGELGDAAFGNSLWIEVLLEYVWRHGWTPGILSVAIDYAQHRRQSVWRTLYAAIGHRTATRGRSFWSAYGRTIAKKGRRAYEQQLVSAECLQRYERSLERFVHPWLKDVQQIPPGQFNLFLGLLLVNSIVAYSPFRKANDAVSISPIASQPVVETCLNIASYLHILNGQNRAVARAAFADRLSPLVVHRGPGKGASNLWMEEVVARNRPFLREYLMDGILVRRGILDRRKLEASLTPDIRARSAPIGEIFVTLYIESWARQWNEPLIAEGLSTAPLRERYVAT